MTPGNLDGVHIPASADPAMVWAVGREYDMRITRYRVARLGVRGVMMQATRSMRSLADALQELDAAHPVTEETGKQTREKESSGVTYLQSSL